MGEVLKINAKPINLDKPVFPQHNALAVRTMASGPLPSDAQTRQLLHVAAHAVVRRELKPLIWILGARSCRAVSESSNGS